MNDLTVLVNSSDGFEDCWSPFFRLFATYWPCWHGPLVLNTERKTYTHPGLDIRCARVAADATRRLTWSECLMRCLDRLETPYLLYLQEDYFLEAPVRTDLLGPLLDELRAGRADTLRLMECGGSGPWHPAAHPWLWRVDQHALYRISLQAALWRRETLRSHLRRHEDAWQLEVFGSARARRRRGEQVLCVNRDLLHGPGREIVPYTPTGVVKGRWERDVVVDLFARHGIEVDYAQRGFNDSSAVNLRRTPLARRLADRVRSLW